ncbi:MAG: 20S proteasome subunit A/B [Gammaproteobacteria bacterium]|nr:20S proteasome subunit A/B [Gammaproteobacteria bacterium]
MTYCLAIRTDSGIVFAADTRTNAGVDYITSYRKLHVFDAAADRTFVIASAGSLATTQEIMHWLQRDLTATDGRESLNTVTYMFEAANYIGRVSRAVQAQHAGALSAGPFSGATTLILGGQIEGDTHELLLIYPQGNFIEASEDTPYLQVGESKYGKPMLDRLGRGGVSLEDAARLAVISLEATIRSNLTVGAPIDLALVRAGTFTLAHELRLTEDCSFYQETRQRWQLGIEAAFQTLPRFEWEAGHDS